MDFVETMNPLLYDTREAVVRQLLNTTNFYLNKIVKMEIDRQRDFAKESREGFETSEHRCIGLGKTRVAPAKLRENQ